MNEDLRAISRALRVSAMLAVALGLALRLWFVFHYALVHGDTLVYGDFAKNLLLHGVYGFSRTVDGVATVRPTLIRLPGYPLFLAACFRIFGMEHYTAVMLVQTVVDLWTCLLVGGIAGRMFGPRAGLAAVWMGALCPFTANYVAAPLTETLTLFCIALAFYALVRWRSEMLDGSRPGPWVWVIGVALAYAILLRPEQGLLAAAIVPAMWWIAAAETRRGWLRALVPVLLVSAITLAPLLPWTVRNWQTFHVIEPLAPRFATDPGEANPYGFQRWYRTWAVEFASTVNCYWNYDGGPIQIADLPNRAFDSNAQYEQTDRLLADYNLTDNATPDLDARFDRLALERIHADPLRYYVALPAARVLDMMFRPRTEMLPVPLEWWRYRPSPPAFALQTGFALLNLAFFALAGLGLSRRDRWRDDQVLVWAMLATIAMRTLLLLTLDNSEPRYTLEFFPVLIVLGASLFGRQHLTNVRSRTPSKRPTRPPRLHPPPLTPME